MQNFVDVTTYFIKLDEMQYVKQGRWQKFYKESILDATDNTSDWLNRLC